AVSGSQDHRFARFWSREISSIWRPTPVGERPFSPDSCPGHRSDLAAVSGIQRSMLSAFGKPERLRAQYLRVLSRVRLLFEVGHAAEDLEDHPEIAVRAEVCNPDAFELAAEDHINASFGLHCQHLVEALSSDGDVVHAPTFLGKETRVDALVVERLDQFPLQLADHSDCYAPRVLDRLAVFAQILRIVASRSRTTIPICIVWVKTGSRIVAPPPPNMAPRVNFVKFVNLVDADRA